MNLETLAIIHETMRARMERDAIALRTITERLATLEADRDALLAPVEIDPADDAAIAGLVAQRYHRLRRSKAAEIDARIAEVRHEHSVAEQLVADALGEVRAVKRLLGDRRR